MASPEKEAKKQAEAMVKAARKEHKAELRKLNDKYGTFSRLPPVAGAAITVGAGVATAYIDGRAGGDNKHPATLIAIGAGAVATIVTVIAEKPSLAHAAADFTAGPATVYFADMARAKGREHANQAKAPGSATAAG
jgi:hypothetical protein